MNVALRRPRSQSADALRSGVTPARRGAAVPPRAVRRAAVAFLPVSHSVAARSLPPGKGLCSP